MGDLPSARMRNRQNYFKQKYRYKERETHTDKWIKENLKIRYYNEIREEKQAERKIIN